MREEKIMKGFNKIQMAFPDAWISRTKDLILIPEIRLPSKFNLPSIPLLMKIDNYSDYKAPDAYVDRRLRVHGRRSTHLDEALTEPEMLYKNWVKLCVQVNWSPKNTLEEFVILALKFLKDLEPEYY